MCFDFHFHNIYVSDKRAFKKLCMQIMALAQFFDGFVDLQNESAT